MADKTDFYVEGYRFGTLADAKRAETEKKEAIYFEGKLKQKDGQSILAVYDKILDEKIFSTPVGWEYLKYLQGKMRTMGVAEEQIRPIPMYVSFLREKEREPLRARIKPAKKRDKSNDKFYLSVMGNVLLLLLVIAMFVITLKSDHPNLLNYRNAIENEYAVWEQELTERENRVREKEAEIFTD